MNEQLEATIGRRARSATNKRELVNAIFDSFVEHEVDPMRVSLEDMKNAVVVACRSMRKRHSSHGASCLA